VRQPKLILSLIVKSLETLGPSRAKLDGTHQQRLNKMTEITNPGLSNDGACKSTKLTYIEEKQIKLTFRQVDSCGKYATSTGNEINIP
jgi:hypothetical protein